MSYKKGFGFVDEERPFNFAELLLRRCNDLFAKANEAAVEGNPFIWYRVLGSLLRAVSFVNIDNAEDEDIEQVRKDLQLAYSKIRLKQKQNPELFYYEIEKTLDQIETKIIKLMYKHRLYYPHYQVKDIEEEMIEGYE